MKIIKTVENDNFVLELPVEEECYILTNKETGQKFYIGLFDLLYSDYDVPDELILDMSKPCVKDLDISALVEKGYKVMM